MRKRPQRGAATLAFVFVAIASAIVPIPSSGRAQERPGAISDQEFWRMVTELSELGGAFQAQFMSNEDSAQFVIPALKGRTRPGGVYIGVGTEQNFTYIAAIQPTLAFIIDIRRDNMVEHLMYKALFELSSDRADFISRLFSRKRPTGLDAKSSGKALFEAYAVVDKDARLFEEHSRAVIDRLVGEHKFRLSDVDKEDVTRILNTFSAAGPNTLNGSGDKKLSYAEAMVATDLTGRSQSYLASEEHFRIVQELQRRNLIVPLVGDFAGDKAISSVGRYLKDRGQTVEVFYVSNVERYLFEGNRAKQFYANVATLPLGPSSTFIRSVTTDISRRLGITLPDGAKDWWSFLFPLNDDLTTFANGRIQTYRELFEVVR